MSKNYGRAALAAIGLIVLALRPGLGTAASAVEIDIKSDATMRQFVETVDGAQAFLNEAKGVLVFPSVFQAGFIFGGQYGEGALRVGGSTVDYYNLAGGSFGFQLGAQTRSVILVFLEQGALDQFRGSKGWQVGLDGSVTLLELGAAASLSSTNVKDPIVGFVFDNKGLMYNLSLEGSKFTKLNKGQEEASAVADSGAAAPPAVAAETESTVAETEEDEDDGIILRRP